MDDFPRIFALYESGQLTEADTLCAAFVARAPENAAGWALHGTIALRRQLYSDAADSLQRAAALGAPDHELLVNLGMALYGAGRIDEAAGTFRKALKLNPRSAVCFMYIGRCCLARERLTEAASALNGALRLHPEWPEALDAFALLSLAVGRPDKAITFVRRALAVEPGRTASQQLGGTACERIGDYEEAAALYRAVIASVPEPPALIGLAMALQRLGRHDEALSVFDQAIESNPSDPAPRHGLGSSLLALGRLKEGWPLYAARFNLRTNTEAARAAVDTPLQEPPHRGMRVVAWADQGIGEQILFASLIPDLVRTGADIAIECDHRLVPLFARSFPQTTVCARTEPAHPVLASFTDGRFCLSDAGNWFRGSFEAFPKHAGYLKPDLRLTAELRSRYSAGRTNRPLVGISWRRANGAALSDAKTLPLDQWGPLLHVAGATFVNLQYGDCAADLDAAAEKFGVRIVSDPTVDPLMNLDAFAAQVAAMDLVISTSSTTAHMAGALNIPAWTLLPIGLGSLWHWFLERSDSPWYPGMTLFRQSTRGDWETVLETASGALVDFVETWRPTARTTAAP